MPWGLTFCSAAVIQVAFAEVSPWASVPSALLSRLLRTQPGMVVPHHHHSHLPLVMVVFRGEQRVTLFMENPPGISGFNQNQTQEPKDVEIPINSHEISVNNRGSRCCWNHPPWSTRCPRQRVPGRALPSRAGAEAWGERLAPPLTGYGTPGVTSQASVSPSAEWRQDMPTSSSCCEDSQSNPEFRSQANPQKMLSLRIYQTRCPR